MSNNAFYVYGIVRFSLDLNWQEKGIAGKEVYMISEGNFSALVHECQEEPYNSKNSEEIKEMIIAHNKILDKAMEDFDGVIPLSFNTIIKGGKNSPKSNLKKWLNDDQERLEKIWQKVKGKKEYGIRIYYERDKLIEKASHHQEVEKVKKGIEGKGEGLSYLLQEKAKSKAQDIFQEKINNLKQEFYGEIKKITTDVVTNPSRISLEEKKDLLSSFSVLVEENKIEDIKKTLEEKKGENMTFHLAGPFAPYSFVDPQK